MTDEPGFTDVGGSAEDPRVQERVRDILDSTGQPAQVAGSLSGSLARAEAATTPSGAPAILNTGEVTVVPEGGAVTTTFSKTLRSTEKAGIDLVIGGNALPIKIRQKPDTYLEERLDTGGMSAPVRSAEPRAQTFSIQIGDYELIISMDHIRIAGEATFTDREETELRTKLNLMASKLTDPADIKQVAELDKLFEKAKAGSQQKSQQYQQYVEEVGDNRSIGLDIRKAAISDTQAGLLVSPRITSANGEDAQITLKILGKGENPGEVIAQDISATGVLIPVPMERLNSVTRHGQAVIKFKGTGEVVITDGDGDGKAPISRNVATRF